MILIISMSKKEIGGVRIDDVLWRQEGFGWNGWTPICPKHFLRLNLAWNGSGCRLHCEEGNEDYHFQREFNAQKQYVQNKIDSKELRKFTYINIDGESVPIADDDAKSSDGRYFVKAILTDSKVGLRLVVYAGEKGKEKTQIFVEPDIKRLAFDQTNTHPNEVFLKLEATFDDGAKSSIEQSPSSR